MVEYLNASNVVEQRRRAAREAGGQGPRTIVRCSDPPHTCLLSKPDVDDPCACTCLPRA